MLDQIWVLFITLDAGLVRDGVPVVIAQLASADASDQISDAW